VNITLTGEQTFAIAYFLLLIAALIAPLLSLCCGITEVFVNRKWIVVLLCIGSLVLVFLFDVPIKETFWVVAYSILGVGVLKFAYFMWRDHKAFCLAYLTLIILLIALAHQKGYYYS